MKTIFFEFNITLASTPIIIVIIIIVIIIIVIIIIVVVLVDVLCVSPLLT